MSWIRSSRFAALVVLLALSLAVVGTAGALTVSEETSINESRAGESVTTTVVIEDPFQGDQVSETWTLNASTELESVRWTVTVLDQGNQINETVYGSQAFQQELSLDNGGDEVRIEVTGETPAVDNYTYTPRERFVLWDLNALSGSNEADLDTNEVHHYTNESRDARMAIDNATAAINESGGHSEAQDTLNSSISSYDNGNFGNAQTLASDALNQVEQSEQSQQQTQMILYGVAALVVVALVGGGIYYWRSQQEEYGKLQ